MRCSRLADVVIQPLNPGLAACAALKWVAGTVGIERVAGHELARGCCRRAAAHEGAQRLGLHAVCWGSVQHDLRPPPDCSPFTSVLTCTYTHLIFRRRVHLASHAVERLQWSAFPALETVRLQVRVWQGLAGACHAGRVGLQPCR